MAADALLTGGGARNPPFPLETGCDGPEAAKSSSSTTFFLVFYDVEV